jgi:hypothetical protein
VGVAVSGPYAYVADDDGGLLVVDITTPESPQIIGAVDTPGDALDVEVSGEYAYVADRTAGLQVIDVTNPTSPQIVAGLDIPDRALNVTVSGSYAYIGANSSGFVIVDVSDPENPQILGGADTPDKAFKVAVSGSYAYVADLYSSLQVADITDPQNPQIIGCADPASVNRAVDVAVVGDYVYLVGGRSGLHILPSQCEPAMATPADGNTGSALRLRAAPNPGWHQTTICFELPVRGHARATIHDVTGREVRLLCDGALAAGRHELLWSGLDNKGCRVAAGVYLVRLSAAAQTGVQRFVVLRRGGAVHGPAACGGALFQRWSREEDDGITIS